MSSWVAIPHAAIAAAGRDGRVAVLDLYERADRVGYAPLLFVERDLADDWGVDRRVVRRILDALHAAGLVVLERSAPGARQPSRVTVLPAVRPVVNQNGNQTRNQNDAGSNVRTKILEPDAEPEREPARAEVFARASEDQTSSSGAGSRAREADPATVDELVRLQVADEPTLPPPTDRDREALHRALTLGVPVERLKLLWEWSGHAPDPDADACRTGKWRRWGSLLKQPRGDRRLEDAVRWDAAGRPRAPGPPARASPRVAVKAPRPWDPPPAPPPDPSEAEPLDEADIAQLRAWGIPVPDPEDPPS